MGNQQSADQPFKRAASLRFSKRERSPGKRMDRLRRSFRDSFRRRKDTPESSKPNQWHADEYAVRSSTCAFDVKYLGCVEVNSQKGIQTCEEALKVLRNSKRRPIRAVLHISGDGLRVVEHKTKGLIVDQIIERVSFCAFDRNHEKGFSYICRDSTATRWMCHGFLALKESGKRLNHAVGCAFYASQERNQRREKDYGGAIKFDQRTSAFTRIGSFRQPSLTERQQDSRERAVDVQPARQVHNPFAIERPHASPLLLERQGSFRGFNQLNQASPFKRQLSLRVSDLPSNLERTRSYSLEPMDHSRIPPTLPHQIPASRPVCPASKMSSSSQNSVSATCQQISRGPSLFSSSDDFGTGITRTTTSTVVRKLFSNTTTTTFLPGLINSRSLDDLKLQTGQNLGDVVLSGSKNNNNNNNINNIDENNPLGNDGISCQDNSSSVISPTGKRLTPILNQCCSLSPVLPYDSVNGTPAMNGVASIFETPAASPVVSIASTSLPSNNTNAAYQQKTAMSIALSESSDANLASASPTPTATAPTPTPIPGTVSSSANRLKDLNAATTSGQPIPLLSMAQGMPSTTNLPTPDPWLDSLTTQATSTVPPVFSASPPPPLHSRALSLDSAAVPSTSARTSIVDPFDAKWAEIAAQNLRQASNTNPFIEPNSAQPFQVQLWHEELQKSIADYYRNRK